MQRLNICRHLGTLPDIIIYRQCIHVLRWLAAKLCILFATNRCGICTGRVSANILRYAFGVLRTFLNADSCWSFCSCPVQNRACDRLCVELLPMMNEYSQLFRQFAITSDESVSI